MLVSFLNKIEGFIRTRWRSQPPLFFCLNSKYDSKFSIDKNLKPAEKITNNGILLKKTCKLFWNFQSILFGFYDIFITVILFSWKLASFNDKDRNKYLKLTALGGALNKCSWFLFARRVLLPTDPSETDTKQSGLFFSIGSGVVFLWQHYAKCDRNNLSS